MNTSKILVRLLAVSMTFMYTNSFAGSSVIGKMNAESSVVINPGASQQRVGSDEFAYVQGQVVSTVGADSAQIVLGQANVTLAPDSIASINADSPLSLNLSKGAISFVAPAGSSVSIESPKGTFNLTSEGGIDAVAVFNDDGELAIMPRSGSLAVTSATGSAVSILNTDNAFVSSQLNQGQVVDVIIGGSNGILLALLAASAAIAGIIIIADDNNPTSP
ncbi:MAG: hypothetical protein P8I38_16370 [Arenicella sp.]|jgi:hypothetical protein|nr:hypothetical protein [Arenicella sp.]